MTQTSSSLKLGGAGILSSKYTGTQEITIGMQYLLAPEWSTFLKFTFLFLEHCPRFPSSTRSGLTGF